MPADLQELNDSIHNAVAQAAGVSLLNKLCEELDYRLDVCRITRGSHIEHS
jgi:hypothetical protein